MFTVTIGAKNSAGHIYSVCCYVKMGKGKRGPLKKICANSLHEEWGSSSQDLICIKKRIMDGGEFLRAFDLKERVTHGLICKDWFKHLLDVC